MRKVLFIAITGILLYACQNEYPGVPESYHALLDSALEKAGDNSEQIITALDEAPENQKEGMAFLISYMPERDLTSLSSDFLIENAGYAYKAREEFPWCKELPDSIFFNEVLPYANTTEDRDPWRKDYYERFSKYVKDEDNLVGAIFAINNPIKDEVDVEYNTKRSRVDASPKQSMEEHMATCTGLSMILTDAFRSVGIPSRLAGTGMWTNLKGNHTWSEVYVNGEWMFTEYYPDTLNKSWFVADAGKADPENEIHWIYAVSYKPTGLYYGAGTQAMHLINKVDENKIPAAWKTRLEKMKEFGRTLPEPYVHGVNVTQRYIDIYRKSMESKQLAEDEVMCNIVVFKDDKSKTSEDRLSCLVEVFLDDQRIDFGYSPARTDDNNNFLKIKLKKHTVYQVVISDQSQPDYSMNLELITNNEDKLEFQLTYRIKI